VRTVSLRLESWYAAVCRSAVCVLAIHRHARGREGQRASERARDKRQVPGAKQVLAAHKTTRSDALLAGSLSMHKLGYG